MAGKATRPGGPFSNGVKPMHAVILLGVFVLKNILTAAAAANNDGHGHDDHSGHAHAEPHDGHGDGHHGYQVFHVEFERVQVPFIISLWIFVSSLAKIGFHMTPKLPNIFPESCLLIVVGIIIGFLLILTSEKVPTTLTPDTFFFYMLPPIILDAGYFMPNRLFFDHLGTILLMAVVGTVFNMLTIGSSLYAFGLTGVFGDDPPGILETFLFASLIVAVDPVAVLAVFEEIHVDEILYIVVFGESLLNDAVTVVLYHMFEAYVEMGEENLQWTDILKGFASFLVVAGGGTIIGVIWGFITGFVTRFTNHARVLEPLFVLVMAYMSYLTAEIFHMSGILAITFCGITMKNYVKNNISTKSQTTLQYGLKMLSSSSETIIFMFLGVATIHDDHEWNWAFVCLTIFLCTFFRVIGVILLSAIANNYRLHKLKVVDQFVMMYGGLRGAVAFALVLLIDPKKVPHAPMFVTTTIAMVYWTVFVQGITIKPLVRFLNVKTSSEKDPTMNERIAGRFMDHVVSGMEGILGELGNLRMRDMYKYFDAKYIKPCLLRENHHIKDPKIIETFEHLTNKDAIEFMKRNPTQFSGMKSMMEMAGNGSSGNFSSFAGGSQPNMENLDMRPIGYTPTEKDMADHRVHHMLSENMFMPRARPRRMSYNRHALDEDELAMNNDVNYKVHMHVRRMMSENKAARRRKVKPSGENGMSNGNTQVRYENEKQMQSGMRVSGSSKLLKDDLIREAIKEANEPFSGSSDENDEEGGIVFAPKTNTISGLSGMTNPAYVNDEDLDRADGSASAEPTAAETTLPWTRERERANIVCEAPVKQREFPAWLKNEDYMTHGEVAEAVIAQPPSDPTAYMRRRGSADSQGSGNDLVGSRRSSLKDYQERPPMSMSRPGGGKQNSRSNLRNKSISETNDADEVSKF